MRSKRSKKTGKLGRSSKASGGARRQPARVAPGVGPEAGAAGTAEGGAQPSGEASPPVVGVGASAGGLEALEGFFAALPPDTGLAFVVVTHQHPGHVTLLPEILRKSCKVPVDVAVDGVLLRPNRVYVTPAGVDAEVVGGRLHLAEHGEDAARHLPIDHFFRSLAEDQKERAVCIILSGTGADGSLGLKAIKAETGMAMVQDTQSAKYAGMPGSAIATGLADYILPPAAMPAQLVAYLRGPFLQARAKAPADFAVAGGPLRQILALLRSRTRHDFSDYKMATVRRRIERRMNVHQIAQAEDYVRFLQENPTELDLLFKELLISVTSFFRDRPAWDVLVEKILPELIGALPEHAPIRVWVPACATGEEAYSIAIVLQECLARLQRRNDVQVFGTDLDARAIATARAGKYPEGIVADVPAEWLARHFTHQGHHYVIRKETRNLVLFAPQNLISDPPFTRLDWISCRNLLIYLEPGLQKRVLHLFHYGLKPGGLLFLGASETIGERSDLFRPLNRQWKLFRREKTVGEPNPALFPVGTVTVAGRPAGLAPAGATKEGRIPHLVEQVLLDRFGPVGVLVNDRGDIICIHGRTGAYLEIATGGSARLNVLEMAREGLAEELRIALRQAATGEAEVVRDNVKVKANGDYARVNVTVCRLAEPEPLRGLLLVVFRPAAGPARAKIRGEKGGPHRNEHLVQALLEAKESLRATVEELATSNEELKSANEELQSLNEEMQSSNEELETSGEELQSLNEELSNVNAEQASKVEELAQARDDMQNLLNSTEVATIFLDNELRIRRYTETASALINLIATDVGRPLFDQTSKLKYAGLAEDCQDVLKTLRARQAEVETVDGTWHLMRILPYRTMENAIDGVVITFVDITGVTLAERVGREAREYFESIFHTVREPLLVLDEHLRLVSANKAFYTLFQWRPRQLEGELIYEIGGGGWDGPELRRQLEQVLPEKKAVEGFRFEADFPKAGHRVLLLNARRLVQRAGTPTMILLALQEITGK
jgi:two-component system CheB/CheR fusion protein